MMKRISFTVDNVVLFEAIKAQGGDCSSIGARLVELCLTGESARNAIGLLAVYGISDTTVETAKERPSDAV